MPRTICRIAAPALAALTLVALAGGCQQSPQAEPTDDGRVPIDPPSSGSNSDAGTPGASGEQQGEYFTVTASDVTYGGLRTGGDQLVSAQVKVCLTALPPGASDTVEVTMDDWSVSTEDGERLKPWLGMEGAPGEGDFANTELAVGQCAAGKIPFLVTDAAAPKALDYANDQGQQLSWPVKRAR